MSAIVLESVLTCPRCGFAKPETMPTDACQGSPQNSEKIVR